MTYFELRATQSSKINNSKKIIHSAFSTPIGGKSFKGPGLLKKHLRTIHKIEGPINVKPEGFDEKISKQSRKYVEMQNDFKNADDLNKNSEYCYLI